MCAATQAWKDGMTTTLYKELQSSKAVKYQAIFLLAVLGKYFIYILVRRLSWLLHAILLAHQYGFRRLRGRTLSFRILQRLIESSGISKSGLFIFYIDLGTFFDRIPQRKLWRALRELNLAHGPRWPVASAKAP